MQGLFLCTLYFASGYSNSEIIEKGLKKEKQLNGLVVVLLDNAFQRLLANEGLLQLVQVAICVQGSFAPFVASGYGH